MRGELEKKLTREFGFMRRIKEKSDGTWYEWQGCSCGDGWYELIRRFCVEVTELFDKHNLPIDVTMHKIEQRGGTLRIHCYTEQLILRRGLLGLTDHFEYLSEHTCEECGAKDKLSANDPPIRVNLRKDLFYSKALCDDCYNEELRKNGEREAERETAKAEAKENVENSEDGDNDKNGSDSEDENKFVLLPEDEFEVEDVDGGCAITGFTGATQRFGRFYSEIPGSICGKTVKALGEEALAYCDFSCVKLPGSLESIGDGALALNFHLSVDIPEGVKTIGENAFWGCSYLEDATSNRKYGKGSLSIPRSVEKIGAGAFAGSSSPLLRCHKDSAAHKHALENCLRYELIGLKRDKENKMRTNQVSVSINRFGNQIAEGYGKQYENKRQLMLDTYGLGSELEDMPAEYQHLGIYADANNLYEALSAALNESIQVVQHFDAMPRRKADDRFESGGSNEVIVFVEHFGEYNSEDKYFKVKAQIVSENVYQALTLAINEVLQESQKRTELPTFGRKENYSIEGWRQKYGYGGNE